MVDKLSSPWCNAVIIKLLGKSISFFALQARLHRDWKTEKVFDIIDIGMGYYVVRFYSETDCKQILTNGPYKIYDHYLAVQPWEANFQPSKATLPKTAVWVHLEAAPMECFQLSMLHHFASLLGKPIKIDQTTLLATRGRFARVCVELDLNESLLVSITVREEGKKPSIVRCVYEGLPQNLFLLWRIRPHHRELSLQNRGCNRNNNLNRRGNRNSGKSDGSNSTTNGGTTSNDNRA